MKKNTLTILILLFAVRVFAQTGVIKEMTGTGELKRAGQVDFVPAKAGDTIERDTVVSTGFKSIALVSVGNTVLTVLTLAEISASAGTETLNVSLQTGRVRADVTPPAGTKASITVRSPSATASVRGTSFEFDTQSLRVLKGLVAFAGSQSAVMLVSAGFTSEVLDKGRAADPVEKYIEELLPPPIAGSGSGFRRGGSVPFTYGEFGIDIQLP
jgi:hypothetical protein